MSRIYFHSPSETAEIYGTERHMMGLLCRRIFHGLLRIEPEFARFLPPNAYPVRELEPLLGSGPRFRNAVELWLSNDDGNLSVNGESLRVWEFGVNTALAVGNDAVKLIARIHVQCEIHGYVEGPNRAWLAGIVEKGVASGVLRDFHPRDESREPPGQWTKLTTMLRARDDEPVVTSYSVCEQFPNGRAAGWDDESAGDEWYDLDSATQWELGLKGIRSEAFAGLEWKPDDWETLRFGHGRDALWLNEQLAS